MLSSCPTLPTSLSAMDARDEPKWDLLIRRGELASPSDTESSSELLSLLRIKTNILKKLLFNVDNDI